MKIKICGLTDPKEADYLNENQVDYAGFVLFFPKSKRNNTIKQASAVMKKLLPEIKKTAVTVSPTLEQAKEIEAAGFDLIQIHGNLSEDVLDFLSIPILKAFNVSDMAQYEAWHSCDKVRGYVFDAQEPGSGKTFDWNLVRKLPKDEKMLFLAGGLCPENVKEAILAIKPDAVDVSSGVESDTGNGKDPEKIRCFCKKVRSIL